MHRVHGRTDDSANASQPPEHSGAVGRSGSAHPGLGRAWAWSWRECSSHGHRARGYKENENTPHHTPREVAPGGRRASDPTWSQQGRGG